MLILTDKSPGWQERRIYMNNVTFNKKSTVKYLIWTFLIAWIVQIVVAVLYQNGRI